MTYRNFQIDVFEIGRGLWHARVRRSDHLPTVIDGIELECLNVGVAWPTTEAALTDAQKYIERMFG